MAGRTTSPAHLFVVGANHHSSTIDLRDRLFIDDDALAGVLGALKRKGVAQAIVLSTCDRVEVQAAAADPGKGTAAVEAVLAARAVAHGTVSDGQLYALAGEPAARHIFAVAASLDSQVIGEPQVLGQIKASHRLSKAADMVGPELEAALQAAYGVAKRVRSETAIGEQPVSMAAAAVQIARDVHGDLGNSAALLLGDGEMGELVARQLIEAGLGRLLVAVPSEPRAQAVAQRLDCHVAPFDAFAAALPEIDIVVAALGGRSYTVSAAMVDAALKRRRRRPVYLVDAAVPGDVDPAVERLEEAFLFGLDDLERVALAGRASREEAADAAWSILNEGLEAFLRGRAERTAAPAVTALREHFEAVRRDVLDEAGGADAEEISRRLVNRLLHEPSEALRRLAADRKKGGAGEAERLLRRLFGLGGRGGKD